VLSGRGWAGSGSTDPESPSSPAGSVGNGALRRAGYNVVTWDARGFGNSGGTVTVDAPDREGRDVQAILSWLARQPEALLDRPGDPRVGMVGGSYGGGIQLVTAGLPGEHRLDVIVPDIAWHSLVTSLYPNDTLKAGWASLLTGSGIAASKGRLDPHITQAFSEGTSTGQLSAESRDWFATRGPGASVKTIRIPTLITQGTIDTLFPLDEAIENYRILRGNGVPVKMIWHCGGHGSCTTPGGNGASPVEARVLAWLRRYLDRDKSVRTGPRFEWVADDGRWRSGADYPLAAAGPLTGRGSGTLLLAPGAGAGSAVEARPDSSGFSLAIAPPQRPVQVVGAPTLNVRYHATGTGAVPRMYAQVADLGHGVVLGNQVTPVQLVLDGGTHTVRLRLESLAAAATSASRYALQLVAASQVFAGQSRTTASVSLSDVRI
jgi:ABC-2 type transport system ATP-binding protein